MPERDAPIRGGRVTNQAHFSGLVRPDEELHLATTMTYANILQEIRAGAALRIVLPTRRSSDVEFVEGSIRNVALEMGRSVSFSIGHEICTVEVVERKNLFDGKRGSFRLQQTGRHVKIDELNYELKIKEPSDRQRVEEEAPSQVDHLGRFAMALVKVDEANAELHQSAIEARSNGATWAELGKLAGISSQAAHQRWNPRAKQLHNERQRRYNSTDRDNEQPSD